MISLSADHVAAFTVWPRSAEHTTIDAQQWKDLTGASRKYTIPLAEFFDAEKLTLRIGDLRRRR